MFTRTKVLQCDAISFGNSICGDVVLDSFNRASRDEDNILDLMYMKANMFGFFIETISIKHYSKMHILTVGLKPIFMISLLLCAVHISFNKHFSQSSSQIFVFCIFGLICRFIPVCHIKEI